MALLPFHAHRFHLRSGVVSEALDRKSGLRRRPLFLYKNILPDRLPSDEGEYMPQFSTRDNFVLSVQLELHLVGLRDIFSLFTHVEMRYRPEEKRVELQGDKHTLFAFTGVSWNIAHMLATQLHLTMSHPQHCLNHWDNAQLLFIISGDAKAKDVRTLIKHAKALRLPYEFRQLKTLGPFTPTSLFYKNSRLNRVDDSIAKMMESMSDFAKTFPEHLIPPK